ncbi:MAG: Nudix family hydrolase [Gammaproteobacteria bacterium]
MNRDTIPTIQVVAAVLKDAQGRVLINQRPAGKPMAGYWEFPGGKIESGETPLAALRRELHEELGITVHDAQFWIRSSHDYPEQRVELAVWRVRRCSGTAQARENQCFAWVKPGELPGWNLLPADNFIVAALRLPPQMLVTPSPEADQTRFLSNLERVLEQGVEFVQLRAPEFTLSHYTALAREVIARCRQHGAHIVLNSEPELAIALGADGAHLSGARLARITGRPSALGFLVGASCHDQAEMRRALTAGLDYVVLGPLLATPSHPHAAILGWDGFARLASSSTLLVYAIGGMLPEHLQKVRELGGYGIAAMRGLWEGYSSPRS